MIMFDLLSLNYIRTLIVDKKTKFGNKRNTENEEDKVKDKEEIINKYEYKNNSSISEEGKEEYSDDYKRNKKNILLTKEKIIELQEHNYIDIKNFINSLPKYGKDVDLQRFTPNREKYSASKISESLIKIKQNQFCKLLEENFYLEKNLKKKKIKNNILGT